MKILHIIAGAAVGGAETFAQDAITALAERGVEQQVICRPHPLAVARYQAAGVPLEPLRFSRLDRWRGASARIAARAAEFGADLVHAWMSRAASFIPPAMPCPVIGWFGDYYDLKYFRHADVFVGVTGAIRDWIIAEGVPPERSFCNHTFGTLPESPSVDRPPGPLLLVLSRMHRVKGIDTMIRAMTWLPGVTLWLAGDGPEREAYRRLAERLGLAARVRFLGWRSDRKALLEASDICVLPSRYEPFGTVIVEAWSMQRPLVATRADGARQYVRDGENGLLVEIDDAEGLAARIRTLLADEALRARIVAGGFADYRAHFSREVVIDKLLATYGEALRLGRRQGSIRHSTSSRLMK